MCQSECDNSYLVDCCKFCPWKLCTFYETMQGWHLAYCVYSQKFATLVIFASVSALDLSAIFQVVYILQPLCLHQRFPHFDTCGNKILLVFYFGMNQIKFYCRQPCLLDGFFKSAVLTWKKHVRCLSVCRDGGVTELQIKIRVLCPWDMYFLLTSL